MRLEYVVTIGVPPADAWSALQDLAAVARCLPGAAIAGVDGDTATGRLKVRVGSSQVTYGGTARVTASDDRARHVAIEATGTELRGGGDASGTLRIQLRDDDAGTRVELAADVTATGRITELEAAAAVSERLFGRFAEALGELLVAPAAAAPPAGRKRAARAPAAGRKRAATAPGVRAAPVQPAADSLPLDLPTGRPLPAAPAAESRQAAAAIGTAKSVSASVGVDRKDPAELLPPADRTLAAPAQGPRPWATRQGIAAAVALVALVILLLRRVRHRGR